MSSRPSRTVRPWELATPSRPVWAWPTCPAGHGRLFVGTSEGSASAEFECYAPWCEESTFDADGWERELEREVIA